MHSLQRSGSARRCLDALTHDEVFCRVTWMLSSMGKGLQRENFSKPSKLLQPNLSCSTSAQELRLFMQSNDYTLKQENFFVN